ncbi:MAG: hypothetical protein PHU85_07215 [Phycisphaerae bacterium]|nr:hypothetical protein [Phycisphaerae bacterium]
MNTITTTIPAGLLTMLVGQVAPDPLAGWANLTAAAMLGVAVLFLLTKYLPSRDKQLSEQAAAFTSSIVAQAQTFNSVTVEQAKVFSVSVERLSDRHDSWEKLRHEDQQRLEKTLRDMTAFCTARNLPGPLNSDTHSDT